ncbi:MAG: IS605 OrfB family transposase, partial [Parcubacteria group bacterium GW2011_GWF2_44_8]
MLLKSMKYEIIKPTDSTWEEFGRVLSELRYKSARIANYTVQLLWQWDNFRWEYKEQEGVFPDNSQKPNFCKILRNRFPEVGVDIIGQTSRWVENRYSSIRKDMFMLRKSVLSFKDNMPIFLNNQSYIRQGYIGIIQKM